MPCKLAIAKAWLFAAYLPRTPLAMRFASCHTMIPNNGSDLAKCTAINTVQSCLDDQACQAVVWPGGDGMLAEHLDDLRIPSICCEPRQEASDDTHKQHLWLGAESADLYGSKQFSVSTRSPCIQALCGYQARGNYCVLKSATLCHDVGDSAPKLCAKLVPFLQQPPSNFYLRQAKITGMREALALENRLANIDIMMQSGFDFYLKANTAAEIDYACGILRKGHVGVSRLNKSLFVGKYIGQDEHWFYGNPNYFKEAADHAGNFSGMLVMQTGFDMGALATTNLQTTVTISWGALLDMFIEMYRQYETHKQSLRQLEPVVIKTCNWVSCLVSEHKTLVPIIKPKLDELLGYADCDVCHRFIVGKLFGGSWQNVRKAALRISNACDIVAPPGQMVGKSWDIVRFPAMQKSGSDWCIASGYVPGLTELMGSRPLDWLGAAVEALAVRFRMASTTTASPVDMELQNQRIMEFAEKAVTKAREQCA